MTPEQRLDRLEHVVKMLTNAGRKARSEWRAESRAQTENINILIHTQMETTEQISSLAVQVNSLAVHVNSLTVQVNSLAVAQAGLAESQKLTDQALRAFINSLRKGRNGKSSD